MSLAVTLATADFLAPAAPQVVQGCQEFTFQEESMLPKVRKERSYRATLSQLIACLMVAFPVVLVADLEQAIEFSRWSL